MFSVTILCLIWDKMIVWFFRTNYIWVQNNRIHYFVLSNHRKWFILTDSSEDPSAGRRRKRGRRPIGLLSLLSRGKTKDKTYFSFHRTVLKIRNQVAHIHATCCFLLFYIVYESEIISFQCSKFPSLFLLSPLMYCCELKLASCGPSIFLATFRW